MKCGAFERSYSAWMDTRKAAPLSEDLRRHMASCASCASFVHSMIRLEEMFERQEGDTGSEIPETAFGLCEIVLQESRNEGPVATVKGLGALLAGCSLAGILMLLPGIAPGWTSALQTLLVFLGLAPLVLDFGFHHLSRLKRMAGAPRQGGNKGGRYHRRRVRGMPSLPLTMLRAIGVP